MSVVSKFGQAVVMCSQSHKGEKLERSLKKEGSQYIYPDSLLLGGSGRVIGPQALRVIAVTALVAL